MKNKLFKLSLLTFLISFVGNSLFAVQLGSETSSRLNGLQDGLSVLSTFFLILKVVSVVCLILTIIVTVVKALSTEAGQRGKVFKDGALWCIISAIVIILAFSLPRIFGLDKVLQVDNTGTSVVRVIEDELPTTVQKEYNVEQN